MNRRILFLGSGGGKSTLVNALLRGDVLPQGTDYEEKTTWTVTELKYAPEKRAVVHFREANRAPQEIPWREFPNYVLRPEDEFQAWPYEKVELFLPNAFLAQGLVLVDTPSWELELNLPLYETDTVVALWDVTALDMAAMHLLCAEELASELDALRRSLCTKDVFFVVNYDREEGDLENAVMGCGYLSRRAADLTQHGQRGFLAVDALRALVGAIEADEQALRDSGIRKLAARLTARRPGEDCKIIPLFSK